MEKKKLKTANPSMQLKLSPVENKIIERYRYKYRIASKTDVVKKIIREFAKINDQDS